MTRSQKNEIRTQKQFKDLIVKKEITKERVFETIEDIKRNYLIACFTIKLDSIYFWSHYANSHKGFCIEYEINENASMWRNIHPVSYQKNLLNTKIGDSKRANLFVKHSDWRVIISKTDLKIPYAKDISQRLNENGKISAIYLGADFDKEKNKDFLHKIDKAIPIYKMKMNLKDDSFNLFSTPFKRD